MYLPAHFIPDDDAVRELLTNNGAADLITLRGARRIAEADVVIWAPSAVDAECVREHARADADLVDFSRVTPEEITDLYRRAAASRQTVGRSRLHARSCRATGA